MSLASVLFLALFGAGLAKIQSLDDIKTGRATGVNFLQQETERHLTQEEVLNSLSEQGLRLKRQVGQPHVNGRHEFLDGYRYGLIHYSGDNSDVVFVLTFNLDGSGNPTQTNLYRSADYGKSFQLIDNQLDPQIEDPLLWRSFFVSPVNKNLLVFASNSDPRIYYTLDEGSTWEQQNLFPSSIDPRTLKFSPKEDNWILAHDPDNEKIYVTTNLGSSWKLVAENVDDSSDYQWGDPNWEDDDSLIYFNQFDPIDRDRGNYTVSLFTQHYPYGSNTQQELDPNLGRHEAFLLLGPYIFVQKTDSNGDITLLVSYNRQPFNVAQIPTPYAHQNYLVSHIEEKQALVIIEHEGNFYNLYLSDKTGVYYSLSLRDLVVDFGVDLEKIEGVNGTMIANQYVRNSPDEANAPIRTLITLDNGGNWEIIHPPDEDVAGNPVNCEPPQCSLHFHMDTSAYARLGVFSTESAPGIIIAHGTLGETLSDDPDLYISRDGGISWHETLSGSYGVNVLDHGGIIVAVSDYHQVQSTTLKYSCNEGLTWSDFDFTDIEITVFGVITEPGEHTTIISLYGVEYGRSNTWVVVTVDFNNIFNGNCTDSDYYEWMPWDDRSDTDCILGSSIVIERRKIDACCLNGQEYVRETTYLICECNEEDFECDYGYARPGEDLSGLCVRDPDVELDDPCLNENTTTYTKSTGYRKIAGDVCTGGDESLYAPFEAECCSRTTEATNGTDTQPTTPQPTTQQPTTPQPTTQQPTTPQPTTQQPTTQQPTQQPTTAPTNSGDRIKLVVLGVLVVVVTLVAGVLVIGIILLYLKYTKLKKRNLQLLTSEEQTFRFQTDINVGAAEDDDEAPLVP